MRNIEYRYDTTGNRITMITPDSGTTTYTYDATKRLTGISNNTGSFIFAYDANGRRTLLTYPNGVNADYTYDQGGNLTQVKHSKMKRPVAFVGYTYDAINNRTSRTETGHAANYRYDAISRLTESVHEEQYAYDGVGNRLTGPQARESYTYNAGNELLSDRAYRYEFDQNGNLIKKTETKHNSPDKHQPPTVTTYAYDDENRLIEVQIRRKDKAKIISFVYDSFGRRIEKTVQREDFDDDDDENGKGGDKNRAKGKKDFPRTTHYLYDNQAIIAEYNDHGRLTAAYTHGPGIDEPLAADIHQEGRIYYHADALGSIVALTDNHGQKVQNYEYDAFGNMKNQGKRINQPFTYTAREYDAETGLYYYRARYYDPKAGRFITRDPISFAGGDVNFYAYVANNPVNFIDPEGLRIPIPWRLSPKWNPKTQAPRTKPTPPPPPPVKPANPCDSGQPPQDGWKLYGNERPDPLPKWSDYEPISGPDIGGPAPLVTPNTGVKDWYYWINPNSP